MLAKIVGIGICGGVLSVLLKQYRKDLAIAVSVLTAVVLMGVCLPYLSGIIAMFGDISDMAGINSYHIKIIVKITGVAYICQFASDVCKDMGETSIAGKIEFGGKVMIISLSMPVIYNLLSIVSKIINY